MPIGPNAMREHPPIKLLRPVGRNHPNRPHARAADDQPLHDMRIFALEIMRDFDLRSAERAEQNS
jgi:hypothetical protein